jgi:hypothetical protein
MFFDNPGDSMLSGQDTDVIDDQWEDEEMEVKVQALLVISGTSSKD